MAEEAKEIIKRCLEKETELAPLRQRMDDDFSLWNMEDVYSGDIKSKTKYHPTDIDIISNELRQSAQDIQSKLVAAEMQIRVGMAEDPLGTQSEEQAKLERLFHFAFARADELLISLLQPPLREQLIWYQNIRGWTAGRFLVYKEKGGVVFDFKPWDPRWVVWEVGGDGLLWAAYKMFRSKAQLKSEHDVDAKTNRNEVWDYWEYIGKGKILNAVIHNGQYIRKPEILNIPSMPVLIMPVATRPPIAGTNLNSIAGYGESLFATGRKLNAIRNRFISIVASHAAKIARVPMINYMGPSGLRIDNVIDIPEGVLNLKEGENRIERMPIMELSPTVVSILEWLSAQIRRTVLPEIPIDKPPPSGTLYNLAQEAGNKIFNPQLKNLSYFYEGICRLIEEQIVAGGITVRTKGIDPKRKEYFAVNVKPVDIKKEHVIQVTFTAQNPWRMIDTYAVADMAKRVGLPDEYIWDEILRLPDPHRLKELAAIQNYEQSPVGLMQRAVVALMKKAKQGDTDALAAANSLIDIMDTMQMMEGGSRGEAEASPSPRRAPLQPQEPGVVPGEEPRPLSPTEEVK